MEPVQLLRVPGLTDLEVALPRTNEAGAPDGGGEARGLSLQRSEREPRYGDGTPGKNVTNGFKKCTIFPRVFIQ